VSGWNSYYNGASGNGTDEFGFSALPGCGGSSDGSFGDDVGSAGCWWSATEYFANSAYYRIIYNYGDGNGSGKSFLLSVRCVQD
jgi:uncharacterized protein (TIGR02145 family)